MNPLVSAVIPTRNRPELVCRAVRSVLDQTYPNVEVIVVVDGPDAATVAALESLHDQRVRIITLCENVGGCDARNIGAKEANGDWVALLDDDDEWLPRKLELQMLIALRSRCKYPLITCRIIVRRDAGDSIMPLRIPKPDEPLSEYLFCRRSFRYGEGIIQTSTIVAPKALFVLVPFTSKLPRHQDWDWLLRVNTLRDVSIEWSWEPLSLFNVSCLHQRHSRVRRPTESAEWAIGNCLLTKRAFVYFAATVIAPQLDCIRDFQLLRRLLRSLLLYGKLDVGAILFGVFFATFPNKIVEARCSNNSVHNQTIPPSIDKMKILQIVTQMEAGGAQRVSWMLREGLAGRGHASKVWFLYVKRPVFIEGEFVESLIRHRPNVLDYLLLTPRLAWKIIMTRPDVIITHTHYANVLGQLLGFACGVNVRIAVQHNPAETYPRVARLMDAVFGSVGIYSRNVLVSPSLSGSLAQYPRAYKTKTAVIRNGISEVSPTPDQLNVRVRLGIPPEAVILVHAGRLSKQKNQEFLVTLMPRLPDTHLILIGEGELRGNLTDLANRLGVGNRVHFIGEVSIQQVYSLLRASDIFLFPSLFEAMPLALIDAMMCGLPVIASDISSAHEVLDDSGIIRDLSSPAAWLEAVEQLSDRAELRFSLAKQARARAHRFTSREMTLQYEALIFEVTKSYDLSSHGKDS